MSMKIGIWITRIVATIIIASLLSIWTTSYIITSYVKQLLAQYELPVEVEHVALTDVIQSLWTTKHVEQPTDRITDEQDNVNNIEDIEDNMVIIDPDEPTDDALWNQPSEEVIAPIEQDEAPVIAIEDVDQIKETMTAEDKEQMFQLLMSKLPTDAWQMISTYMEDGLTESELLEVQQVMALHMSKEEYKQLLTIMQSE